MGPQGSIWSMHYGSIAPKLHELHEVVVRSTNVGFVGSYDRIPLAPPPESCAVVALQGPESLAVPCEPLCQFLHISLESGRPRFGYASESPADCMHYVQPNRMIQSLIIDYLGGYPWLN